VKKLHILLAALLALSLVCSVLFALPHLFPRPQSEAGEGGLPVIIGPEYPLAGDYAEQLGTSTLHVGDANSRANYFSVHNIWTAREHTTGKGVKVGILDWCFDYENQSDYYAGFEDFTGIPIPSGQGPEHGYWMATVLREIAPDAEIYALNAVSMSLSENKWVDAMVRAVDWAIEHDLDVLTLSHQRISEAARGPWDAALERAYAAGVVTTFLHTPHERNLMPGFMSKESWETAGFDVNIFSYDYNTLLAFHLKQYFETPELFTSGEEEFYHSASSTSPVLGGFVALLLELDPDLTPDQCREILIETSYPARFKRTPESDAALVPRVVDMGAAVEQLLTQ